MAEEGPTMADLTIDYITSLDGFGSADGWPGLWGMGGPDYDALLEQDGRQEYRILLGATTYRLFARTGEEDMAEVTARPKVVFSRSLTEPLEWANTTLVAGDAVEAVRASTVSGWSCSPWSTAPPATTGCTTGGPTSVSSCSSTAPSTGG